MQKVVTGATRFWRRRTRRPLEESRNSRKPAFSLTSSKGPPDKPRLPSARDVLGAVDADDVSRNPRAAVAAKGDESARHIGRLREPAGRVHRLDALDHGLVARDLAQRGRVGDSRAQSVGGDSMWRQLHRDLPDVGLQRRLGRGNGAVGGPDDVVAGRRHREDARAPGQEASEEEILRPVDEGVGHHVERHLDLGLGDRALARLGEEGLERAEGQRMEEDGDARLRRLAAAGGGDRGHDLAALGVVGGIDVEELGAASRSPNLADDAVDVGLRGLAVEVHAEDVPAGFRQGDRAGLAESGRGAQDESPAYARFGGQSGGILVHSFVVAEALGAEPRGGATRTLGAALLLLAAMVWLEPAGSGLAEPDETRYAEIPREMLAAGDLLVPRLNGVPYFEKPPLLYWLNAASLRVFGETPWAARLPTRLAGTGTVLLVFLAARG